MREMVISAGNPVSQEERFGSMSHLALLRDYGRVVLYYSVVRYHEAYSGARCLAGVLFAK